MGYLIISPKIAHLIYSEIWHKWRFLLWSLYNKARKHNFPNSKNDNKIYILLTEANAITHIFHLMYGDKFHHNFTRWKWSNVNKLGCNFQSASLKAQKDSCLVFWHILLTHINKMWGGVLLPRMRFIRALLTRQEINT